MKRLQRLTDPDLTSDWTPDMATPKVSGIYAIVNLTNGKRYVGSSLNFDNRWAKHLHALRHGKHHSRHLQNAYRKYGEAVLEFIILEACGRDDLLAREQVHIDQRAEYNVCAVAGSPLGIKHSEESRQRMSAKRKGVAKTRQHVEATAASMRRRYEEDSDYLAKRSQIVRDSYTPELRALRGEQSRLRWSDPEYRRRLSAKMATCQDAEQRKQQGQKAKLRWEDPQYRERMSLALSGRAPPSAEVREKIRQTLLGRPLSIETRRKKGSLTDDQVSQVLQLRLGGCRYDDIAAEFSVSQVCIARICRRERYQWVDPEIPPMIDHSRRRK